MSPLGSVVMPRSASFMPQATGMNARVVLPRGFGVAAGFCLFKLWVQEGTAASALATSHPDSVAESFLDIGNAIVRCQDTSRARRPGGGATCGRPACGTSLRSWLPAARHPLRGVCSSGVPVESCQTTVGAALGVAHLDSSSGALRSHVVTVFFLRWDVRWPSLSCL